MCVDRLDLMIVSELQANARISTAELGRKIGLSTSATAERITKLEKEGVIQGYSAIVDGARLGAGITAFILVPVGNMTIDEMAELIISIPQVQECHKVSGNACFMVKVKAGSMDELEQTIDRINQTAPNTYSYIVLSTVRETAAIPINLKEEKDV
ncbi:MAG: Lrp/AsnC family transcriptional regulator [Firmicutes bacterium]|nr:Lrp/AsnC family transcriptional regulator [Bacillota bacterium]